MSILTEALEKILSWLQQNKRTIASALQPGLTYTQIQDGIESLPFDLPEEVYELYQWRNGTRNDKVLSATFFPAFTFNSLEQSLSNYKELLDFTKMLGKGAEIEPDAVWNPKWFPIFSFEGQGHYYAVIGSESRTKTSPILDFSIEDIGAHTKYTSLTNMMLTIVECYETKAYYLGELDLAKNEDEAEYIRLKYNPEAEFYGIISPENLSKPPKF